MARRLLKGRDMRKQATRASRLWISSMTLCAALVAAGCGSDPAGGSGSGGAGASGTGGAGPGGAGAGGAGSGGAGRGGAGGAGTGGTGGAGTGGAGRGGAGAGGAGAGAGGAGAGGAGGSTGRLCGGLLGASCATGEYCDYGANRCGNGDEQGQCKARPGACPDLYAPVCACNGMTYGNECDANAAGFDVAASGGCPAPQGMFACGTQFCQHGTQYCRRDISDVGGFPDGFSCHTLPAACGTVPSCACVRAETCGSSCEATAASDLTVSCAGG